jgi:hypothetical protein
MTDAIDQHIVGILKELRSEGGHRVGPGAAALWLRKYLENLPHNDLLSMNAVMYAGRDQNPPSKIEHYIERCGIFTKEELVQAMVVRQDNLQEYLNRGMVLARSNLDFASGDERRAFP